MVKVFFDPNSGRGFIPFPDLTQPVHETGGRPSGLLLEFDEFLAGRFFSCRLLRFVQDPATLPSSFPALTMKEQVPEKVPTTHSM